MAQAIVRDEILEKYESYFRSGSGQHSKFLKCLFVKHRCGGVFEKYIHKIIVAYLGNSTALPVFGGKHGATNLKGRE